MAELTGTGIGYGEDLAHIHDAGFGELAEAGASHLLHQFAKQGTDSGLVLDLGCGSGIAAQMIAAAGFDVVGIDRSPEMVALARARLPEGDFRVGSFIDAELPQGATAIVAIGEVLNYVFDERNGPGALSDVFERVYAALEPGGVFLFDLSGPGRVGADPVRTWRAGPDWAVLAKAVEDPGEGRLTRSIVTFRDVGGEGYRRSEETHELRLYGANAVLAALAGAGLRSTTMRGYDGQDLFPGHRAYLARRPA
jgi:SAM-dependent methyltransferase